MRVTILGSGTSMGVPVIGCACPVCTSADPRNHRLRCSALVEHGGGALVIDTGPEFRIQMLRAGVRRLDAVLYTHAHADHMHGLDDLRAFNFLQDGAIPVYALRSTIRRLRASFPYIFETGHASTVPLIELIEVDGKFPVIGLEVTPLEVEHGPHGRTTAFLFEERRKGTLKRFAYLVDVSRIPEEVMKAIAEVDLLVIDALRHEPHPTHFSVADALAAIEAARPKRALLTHISHGLDHATLEGELPPGVQAAYDGLELII